MTTSLKPAQKLTFEYSIFNKILQQKTVKIARMCNRSEAYDFSSLTFFPTEQVAKNVPVVSVVLVVGYDITSNSFTVVLVHQALHTALFVVRKADSVHVHDVALRAIDARDRPPLSVPSLLMPQESRLNSAGQEVTCELELAELADELEVTTNVVLTLTK